MRLHSKYFDIHSFVSVKLNYPKKINHYPGINFPFQYFEVDNVSKADIVFSIGKFKRKKGKCDIIFRKFEIDEKYIYYKNKSQGSEYEAEISFDSKLQKFCINFNWIKKNYLDYLFPYYRPQLLILEPIIEFQLLMQDKVLLHAGAISTEAGAILITGRSGSNKSPIIKNLILTGHAKYLGDDKIILNENKIYSFPKNFSLFESEFSGRNSANELNNPIEKIRSLLYLHKKKERKYDIISSEARLNSTVLLLKNNSKNKQDTNLKKIDNNEMNNILKYNNYSEFWNYYDIWETFIAYSYFEDSFQFNRYIELLDASIRENSQCLNNYTLAVPKKINDHTLEKITSKLELIHTN